MSMGIPDGRGGRMSRRESREVAARATAAKWGGTPDVRELARDLLTVLGELDDAREKLSAVETLLVEAEQGEGIVITPGFTTYHTVDAGLLREALGGAA